MSRYVDIEGDWVDEVIKTYSLGYYDDDEYAIPFEALDSAPSIDIVRCGECKYYIDNTCDCYSLYGDLSGDLIGVSFEPNENFFCSYGEREGER